MMSEFGCGRFNVHSKHKLHFSDEPQMVAASVSGGIDVTVIHGDVTKVISDLDVLVCPITKSFQAQNRLVNEILKRAKHSDLMKFYEDVRKECAESTPQFGEVRVSPSFGLTACKYLLHVVVSPESASHRPTNDLGTALERCFETLKEAKATSVAIPVFERGRDLEVLTEKLGDFLSSEKSQLKLKSIILFSSEIETAHDLRKWIELQCFPCKGNTPAECAASSSAEVEGKVAEKATTENTDDQSKDIPEVKNKENVGKEEDDNKGRELATKEDFEDTDKASLRKIESENSESKPMQKERERCPVCFDEIKEASRHKLPTCEHSLCCTCFPDVARFSSLCPVCRKAFDVVKGNQPANGTMHHTIDKSTHLPGFGNCGTIMISYCIPSGTQTAEHPKPGQPFYGASRHAYLPNNSEGQKALQLLQKAFNARLIFTVGRSITTGMDDVVTWNDIHHKTSTHGGPEGYGYPDNTYLARLIEDLAAKGITE